MTIINSFILNKIRDSAKYVFVAMLCSLAAYEVMSVAWGISAKHDANKLIRLIATLKPGETTKDGAIASFEAREWKYVVNANACNIPGSSCEDVFVGVGNYRSIIVNPDPPFGISFWPIPPFKPADFGVNLYFVNGVLDSINEKYAVGMTVVAFSRYGRDYEVKTSEWRYTDSRLVTRIGVATSGGSVDAAFPKFDFNYMYTARCADARMLWPSAPPPTTELHGRPGCR